MQKRLCFSFSFNLEKVGEFCMQLRSVIDESWWSCLIQVVMLLWAMQEPKPKRGFLRKSYNELFRCHFLDRSFVSFFGGNIKKSFMIAKLGHALVHGKKSHLRIKNSWRLFLAGHNHPGQQTFHLYTSPLWLSQGFATFKKGGVAPLHPIRSRSWNEPLVVFKNVAGGRAPPDLLWWLVRAKCSTKTWLV